MAESLSIEREQQLIELARSKTKLERDEAFSSLVRALGPSLHALCLGVTGSRVDAEDAVQDTLYTLATDLARFRGDARLYTWCYRIALRAAVRIKAKNRRQVLEELPAARDVDGHDTARAIVERNEAQRTLAALVQLPIEQRTVLTLIIDGRSHDEIAEILDVPTGTVWSRLHVGRKRLRELLA